MRLSRAAGGTEEAACLKNVVDFLPTLITCNYAKPELHAAINATFEKNALVTLQF
jgi:hypothetical protein